MQGHFQTPASEDMCSIELAIKYIFYGARTHMAGCAKAYVEAKIIELIFQNRCHSEHLILSFSLCCPSYELSCHCQLERTFVVANNHQPKFMEEKNV